METNVTLEAFDKICRICIKYSDSLLSISLHNIIDMIKKCASVEIWINDSLPNNICNQCLIHLRNAYNFNILCQKSDNDLRRLVQNKQNHNSDEKPNHADNYSTGNESDLSNDKADDSFESKNDNKKSENENIVSTDEFSKLKIDKYTNFVKAEKDNCSRNKCARKYNKKYTCNECNTKFYEVWHLGLHMKRIHKTRGTKCKKCSLICYHPLHLSMHEKAHDELNYVCSICNKQFSNNHKLSRHKNAHATERPFHCYRCDYSFKDKWVLKKHVKTMHLNKQKYVACHVCGKSIVEAHLQHHLRIHEKRTTVQCGTCAKAFLRQSSLEKHMKRIHQNVARECNRLCNICGRGVGSEAELKAHLRTHTGEKPFSCDKCDKKYRTKSALKTHVSRAHLDERKHTCSICMRGFYDRTILENHMRTHTGERPFKCHICGKNFGFKIVLKTHMKVHSM